MLFKISILALWSSAIWAGGWLQINSQPAQAAVYINGEYRGLTPKSPDSLQLNLVNGEHRLRLHWSQGQDYYQKITISEGQNLLLNVQQKLEINHQPIDKPKQQIIMDDIPIQGSDDSPNPPRLIPIPRNF